MKRNINEKVVLAGYIGDPVRKSENLVKLGIQTNRKDEPDWNDVAIFNTDKVKFADDAERYLKKGHFITVVAIEKENGKYKNLVAQKIFYGCGKADLGDNKFLIVGKVSTVTRKSEKFVVVGINSSNKKDNPNWHNVAVFNTDKVGYANNAEKYLTPGQIVVTIATERENGEYKNLFADYFEYGPKPRKNNSQENNSANSSSSDITPGNNVDYNNPGLKDVEEIPF